MTRPEISAKPVVLVVDDEPANIAAIASVLSDDIDIRAATGGQDALEALKGDADVDLILLDVVMPDMTGYEVCAELKRAEKLRDIPVIFVTALDEQEEEARGLRLGAVDYIAKPIHPEVVRTRVMNHLELKLHRDHLNEMVADRTREIQQTVNRLKIEIEERKRTQADLEYAHERAAAGNRAKTEFLSNISHEFRTPLNVVLGMAEILAARELDNEQTDCCIAIRSAAEKLLMVLQDIVDIASADSERAGNAVEPFELESLVKRGVSTIEYDVASKGLDLRFIIDRPGEQWYRGNHRLLRQVLVKLLENAVKFTDKGRIELTVATEEVGDGRFELHFTVTDTGRGIPAGSEQTIFEPFTQVDGSLTRRYEGAGLGLTVCKRFVDLLGGDIGVVRREGGGSTFWFVVPLEAVEQPLPGCDSPPETCADPPDGRAREPVRGS